MQSPSLGEAKLETKNIFDLNLLGDFILHIIAMEIGYIFCGCTLYFLFIRNDDVCMFIYVNNIERPIPPPTSLDCY